ncbi:MAG: hypothetical protein P8X57_05345, partial [Cyclobacteriaceae bacterium]
MKQPYGKVYVRYAEPLALGDEASLADGVSSGDGNPSDITRMAFEVCSRIEQITPIKSTDVLTMVLLGANDRAMTTAEIHRQAADIATLVRERELPAASGFSLDNEEQVQGAVLALERSGLIKSFSKTLPAVYYIPPNKRLAAAYYRNTITHYFLNAALAEIGLATCALGIEMPGETVLNQYVLDLRDLYKFEFYYKPTDDFLRDVQREAQQRYPDWNSGETSLQK